MSVSFVATEYLEIRQIKVIMDNEINNHNDGFPRFQSMWTKQYSFEY